jgi:hypothetical protein
MTSPEPFARQIADAKGLIDRAYYCRRELARYLATADQKDPRYGRTVEKLEHDLKIAELDAGWAAHRFNLPARI